MRKICGLKRCFAGYNHLGISVLPNQRNSCNCLLYFANFVNLGQVNALEVPYFTNTFTQLQNLGGIMKRHIKLTTSHFFKFRDVYARMGSISAMKIYFLQQKIREVIKKMEWNMTLWSSKHSLSHCLKNGFFMPLTPLLYHYDVVSDSVHKAGPLC